MIKPIVIYIYKFIYFLHIFSSFQVFVRITFLDCLCNPNLLKRLYSVQCTVYCIGCTQTKFKILSCMTYPIQNTKNLSRILFENSIFDYRFSIEITIRTLLQISFAFLIRYRFERYCYHVFENIKTVPFKIKFIFMFIFHL